MRTFKFVVERDPETGVLVGYVPGWPGAHTQGADIDELQQNLREVIEMLLEDGEPNLESEFVDVRTSRSPDEGRPPVATMSAIDRIEMDPKVMMGKPVARGTPITVELLLRKLAEGATEVDLLDAYPRLTREDIKAAIDYAADVLERGPR